MSSLSAVYDPRRNNFDVIRLSLAALVAVSHGIVIQTGSQPYWGQSDLGDFAVDGFFVLSGFLVTSSYLRLKNFVRYGWHRFLRIMPGFWVCLLTVGLVVAPVAALLDGLPATTPFTVHPTVVEFWTANAGLLINEFGIAGLLADNPTPYIFVGSLWTLVFEAGCYLALGALGLLGLLRRRWAVPTITGCLWILVVLEAAGVAVPVGDLTLRMSFMFFLGATAFVLAGRIPMHAAFAVIAVAVLVASIALFENYRVLGAGALVYVLLWLSVSLPWKLRLRTDVSYGLFMYHWPVQQLLVMSVLATVPTAAFVAVSIGVSAVPAMLSWRIVERPALRRKHWTPRWIIRRRSSDATQPSTVPTSGDAAGVGESGRERS